jgi:hypothetical protein
MFQEKRSRREVLRTTAGLGAVGATTGLAGCGAVESLLGGGGDQIALVPDVAQSATYSDVTTVLNDDATERLVEVYIDEASESEYYDGPESYGDVRDSFEEETNLPPSAVEYQVSFSQYSEYGVVGDYSGTIVEAGWSEAEVVDAYEAETGATYEEEPYEDGTLYVADSQYVPTVGVVSEGTYVNGERPAVEDVLEVDAGERGALADPLKSGYTDTQSAPVRFVGEMAPWIEGDVDGPDDAEFSLEPLRETEYVAGSVYRSGDTRGAETTFHAEDADTAADVENIVSGYISVVQGDEDTAEELKTVLRETDVSRDGEDVVVNYEATVGELETLFGDAIDDDS